MGCLFLFCEHDSMISLYDLWIFFRNFLCPFDSRFPSSGLCTKDCPSLFHINFSWEHRWEKAFRSFLSSFLMGPLSKAYHGGVGEQWKSRSTIWPVLSKAGTGKWDFTYTYYIKKKTKKTTKKTPTHLVAMHTIYFEIILHSWSCLFLFFSSISSFKKI